MTQDEEPGFTLHCSCVSLVIVVVGATALAWWWRGRDALWIAGLVAIIVVGTPIVMTLLECRWFIVTAADRVTAASQVRAHAAARSSPPSSARSATRCAAEFAGIGARAH